MASTIHQRIGAFARNEPFQSNDSRRQWRSTILQSVATDKVSGRLRQRAEDCWFVLDPFAGVYGLASAASLVTHKRAVVILRVLLARARSGDTAWGPSMRVAPRQSTDDALPGSTFWIDLLHELCPGLFVARRADDAELLLIASRRLPMPKFLLSVREMVGDVVGMLKYFLLASNTPIRDNYSCFFQKCGATWPSAGESVVVEVGLSFFDGVVTLSMVKDLAALLARNEAEIATHAVHLRVTTLRFVRDCEIQAKALVALGQLCLSGVHIEAIRVNELPEFKPMYTHPGVQSLTSARFQLCRVAMVTDSRLTRSTTFALQSPVVVLLWCSWARATVVTPSACL